MLIRQTIFAGVPYDVETALYRNGRTAIFLYDDEGRSRCLTRNVPAAELGNGYVFLREDLAQEAAKAGLVTLTGRVVHAIESRHGQDLNVATVIEGRLR